jgi:hypothetical protein
MIGAVINNSLSRHQFIVKAQRQPTRLKRRGEPVKSGEKKVEKKFYAA